MDVNTNHMYFEIHKNSDFEQLFRDEEICDMEQPKPELLPDVPTPNILHPEYLSKSITIKKEPLDPTSSIIGEIISQPAQVARDIKQKMLDSTTQAIVEKHSSSCQINQFIHEHGSTGIRIEHVRSLITAHEDATQKLQEQQPLTSVPSVSTDATTIAASTITTTAALHMVTSPSVTTSVTTSTLSMVTTPTTKATLPMVSPCTVPPSTEALHVATTSDCQTAFALCNVPSIPTTKTTLQVVSFTTRATDAEILLVATTSASVPTPAPDTTLSMVTALTTQTTLSVVSTSSRATVLLMATGIQNVESAPTATSTKWSRITNKPLEHLAETTSELHSNAQVIRDHPLTQLNPDIDKSQAYPQPVEATAKEKNTEKTLHNIDHIYYDVMNPEGDEMYSFSHQDIVSCTCQVPLEKLTSRDIADIKQYLKPDVPGDDSALTTSDMEVEPLKKHKETESSSREKTIQSKTSCPKTYQGTQ